VEKDAADLIRRLIPLSESEVLLPLSRLPAAAAGSGILKDQVTGLATASAAEQPSAILSRAASILDEEMARGVLGASRARPPSPVPVTESGNPSLRQVHDLVDQIAAGWKTLQGSSDQWRGQSAPSEPNLVAELRSPATLRAGQRATISMTVNNSESSSVRLVPTVTDLLGSRGGRIAGSLLEFTPKEVVLDPHEAKDLAIALMVPAGTLPGCYSGLLVVKGVDYLRALVTIDIA